MSVVNRKVKKFDTHIKRLVPNGIATVRTPYTYEYIDSENAAQSEIRYRLNYIQNLVPSYKYPRGFRYTCRNLFRGTQYNVQLPSGSTSLEIEEDHIIFTLDDMNHINMAILKYPNPYGHDTIVLTYGRTENDLTTNPDYALWDDKGNPSAGWLGTRISPLLDYYFDLFNTFQDENGEPWDMPKDFDVITKSKHELENIDDIILLVFVGSACLEIIRYLGDDGEIVTTPGGELITHRYLAEGWDHRFTDDINKPYYTDLTLGDGVIQGDESRNAALSVIAPTVEENTGPEHGNLGNEILSNMMVQYYTKPLHSTNNYALNTAFSFDGSGGSRFESSISREIIINNIASSLNNKNNDKPYLYNVFIEFPDVEDFDYIYFTFDFTSLLHLKDVDRAIAGYINNKYTGANFSETAPTKLNNQILFDSIGLLDFRFFDKKQRQWISTNIVSKTYYSNILSSTSLIDDPLGIIADCINAEGNILTSGSEYSPFYDYENSELIVPTGSDGQLDYSNVTIKLAVKDGFKTLVSHDYIDLDETGYLVYTLAAPDNEFELNDKKVFTSQAYGKKLLWLSAPPIVQHIGGVNDELPSFSQFYVDDPAFGPSDLSVQNGAPLHGRYPVDIYRILKSMRVE